MVIEVECAGCGQRLEVDEQFAGKTATCPVCHTEFEVPASHVVAAVAEPAVWYMKTPEGRTYGPVTRTELDRWVSEGRVSHDCELREEADLRWTMADDFYAVLRPGLSVSSTRGNPFGPSAFPSEMPAPAEIEGAERPRYLAPHRGGLILALGILAFVVAFPVLSFLAWTMGANDLREMREGRMDSSGMNMTHAGMVLGMLLSVVTIVGIMGLVFYVLFYVAI